MRLKFFFFLISILIVFTHTGLVLAESTFEINNFQPSKLSERKLIWPDWRLPSSIKRPRLKDDLIYPDWFEGVWDVNTTIEDFPTDQKYAYEQRGRTTIRTYSNGFSSEYHKRLNGMVERRLRRSIIAVGSIWYTAWVDAGQPDLSSLQRIPPSESLLNEFKELDHHFHNDEHKGRICE